MVECLTQDRGVAGCSLPGISMLRPWAFLKECFEKVDFEKVDS